MTRKKAPKIKLPLMISLFPEERDFIETAARRAGTTISPFMVAAALEKAAKAEKVKKNGLANKP